MAQRLEPLDPLEKVLRDLGKMRGSAANDLLRLPVPSPFKRALEDVDRILGGVEDDINRARATALQAVLEPARRGPIRFRDLTPGQWAAGLRARFGR